MWLLYQDSAVKMNDQQSQREIHCFYLWCASMILRFLSKSSDVAFEKSGNCIQYRLSITGWLYELKNEAVTLGDHMWWRLWRVGRSISSKLLEIEGAYLEDEWSIAKNDE